MFMHGHATWTGSTDLQRVHAAWKYSVDNSVYMQYSHHEHAAWECSVDIQCGYTASTCSMGFMDMQHRYAAWTSWSMDMQRGHAAWTCSRGMKRGHAAWTCSTYLQHGHATNKCSKGMQEEHATSTCSIGIQQEPAALLSYGTLKGNCGKSGRSLLLVYEII